MANGTTPTIPPASQPATPTITPSPLGPYISKTIDENSSAFVYQQKNLQRLIYELNADLARATITIPVDLTIAAQQVLQLSGFGTDIDGNWLIETHDIILSSSSNAESVLTMRKCQDVAALYAIPGAISPNPSAQQTNNPTSSSGQGFAAPPPISNIT
jgi:hypothetical protein